MDTMHQVFVGVTLAAMLLPVPAMAQKTSYDIAPAQFSGLKTFAFKESPAETETEATTAYDSPLVEARTHAAIAAQLEAYGLKRDDEHPDMYVTTRRTFKTEYTVYDLYGGGYAWGLGWGPYYPGWGSWYGGVDERIIGTLIVDMQDASTGQLLWRGLATKHVHEHASPEHRTKRVNKEVAKLFEKFPR